MKGKEICGFEDLLQSQSISLSSTNSTCKEAGQHSEDKMNTSEEAEKDGNGITFEELYDDKQRKYLNVKISKAARSRMSEPYKNSLIVKVLGIPNMDFGVMKYKLDQFWAKKGEKEKSVDEPREISVELPDNDFFVVKFSSEEGLEFALKEGPWLIFDHYLTIRKWEWGFDAKRASIDTVEAWVRITGLPLEFFDQKLLTELGNKIGRFKKLDITEREKYARICVEIDLKKPLLLKFTIEGKEYGMEYESLQYMICSQCGLYDPGHKSEDCPTKNTNIIGEASTQQVVINPVESQNIANEDTTVDDSVV